MASVFISYVEEDARIALQIASCLEKAGFSSWYYERDAVPGLSYLIQTGKAVEECHAFIIIISANSLSSHQVTKEVVRAHESAKPFLPVLVDMSHVEFQNRQPEWREAIGATASISLSKRGIDEVCSALIKGLDALNIRPNISVIESSDTQKPSTAQNIVSAHNLPNQNRTSGRTELQLTLDDDILPLTSKRNYAEARIILKLSKKILNMGFQFGLLHVRDGKDQIPDKGPLLNQEHFFKEVDRLGNHEVIIRYDIHMGFQFKCFADFGGKGISFEKAEACLHEEELLDVSLGAGKSMRAWFILPDFPTCETIDGIINNYYYPA